MSQETEMKLWQEIDRLKRQVERLKVGEVGGGDSWVYLTTPLTSTSWDGDSYSDTAKTLIDLSSVFGAPAGIKAILARLAARDSGSSGQTSLYFGISPNDDSVSIAMSCRPTGTADSHSEQVGICPCDENGDIYYQINASGTNTMDCWFQIWGYWL